MALAVVSTAGAQTIVWGDPSTGGEWTTPGNWAGGEVPNGAGVVADFNYPSTQIDITIASPVTIGVIDNAKANERHKCVRSLAGAGSITVDNNGSEAIWDWGHTQGMTDTFTWGVPVTLNDDLKYNGNSRNLISGWAMDQPISGTGQLHLQIGDDDDTTGAANLVFWDMNVPNSYSGGTVVSSYWSWTASHGATVRLNAEQSLGTGNVSLKAGLVHDAYSPGAPHANMTNSPVGSLWITDDSEDTGADGDNRIHDDATLSLESWNDTVSTFYTWVHLDADVNETVARLMIDGVEQSAGTYGSKESGANNKDDNYFRGPGILTVISGPPTLAITSITSLGGGTWELTLEGEADTGYEFRSSPTLEFDPGDLVDSLTQNDPTNDPGTVTDSNLLTTDSNGDGTVRMMLTGNPADFVRAQIPPPPPPVLEEDFEEVTGPTPPTDWTRSDSGDGTSWEVGVPSGSATGPDAAANGTQCAGTNIGGDYTASAEASLVTKAFTVPDDGATLSFSQYIDTDLDGTKTEVGSIRLLNAGDNSVLAGGDVAIELEGITEAWSSESIPLPDVANGLSVKLEFRFVSNATDEFAGFYIDDVVVTAN